MPAKSTVTDSKKLPPANNYALIKFDYQRTICLPYSAFQSFIASMELAEGYDETDWGNPKIVPIDRKNMEITFISHEEYIRLKTAHLLGVPSSEVDLSPEGKVA
ncbi:hypothetical protein [Marinobacterium litorale]|uniref:hypothetical protein n=1 Tax=Marinobacterium litorale TaxID=404770 RepID=UPI00047F6941|nr:hypothetical protein [Marinobacterium litorale]